MQFIYKIDNVKELAPNRDSSLITYYFNKFVKDINISYTMGGKIQANFNFSTPLKEGIELLTSLNLLNNKQITGKFNKQSDGIKTSKVDLSFGYQDIKFIENAWRSVELDCNQIQEATFNQGFIEFTLETMSPLQTTFDIHIEDIKKEISDKGIHKTDGKITISELKTIIEKISHYTVEVKDVTPTTTVTIPLSIKSMNDIQDALSKVGIIFKTYGNTLTITLFKPHKQNWTLIYEGSVVDFKERVIPLPTNFTFKLPYNTIPAGYPIKIKDNAIEQDIINKGVLESDLPTLMKDKIDEKQINSMKQIFVMHSIGNNLSGITFENLFIPFLPFDRITLDNLFDLSGSNFIISQVTYTMGSSSLSTAIDANIDLDEPIKKQVKNNI